MLKALTKASLLHGDIKRYINMWGLHLRNKAMALKHIKVYSKDKLVLSRLGMRLQRSCQLSLESMQQLQSVGLMNDGQVDVVVLDPSTLRAGEAAVIIQSLQGVENKPKYLINVPDGETVTARADREMFVKALRDSGVEVTENEARLAEEIEEDLESYDDY